MLGVAQNTSMLYASSQVNRDLVITNNCLFLGRVASASSTPRFGVRDPCENPGLQPNDWNKTLRAVRVILGTSSPGATIVDMDIETVTELDDQIAFVVEPSRSWIMPSRLSLA